jgi:DNA-binding transcriptional regulator YiaG
MSQSIAKRIISFRRKHSLSQADFAKKLKVQQSTVSRWENGATVPMGLYAALLRSILSARAK